MSIIFDQFQRYKNAEKIINQCRKVKREFSILEVGANEHKNLEMFLPNDNIKYLDIELSEERKTDPQYILGDATQMDFEDNSFDFIVALDVYEHILPERRVMFLKELCRVSKLGFIVGAPFDTTGVSDTEIRVNEVFRALYGTDHPWLIEHIENGLPNFEETKKILEQQNISYKIFSHGSLDIWERMMKMHFFSIMDIRLQDYVDKIYDLYNNNGFESDYVENSYRKFIIGIKDDRLIIDVSSLKNNKIDLEGLIKSQEKTFYDICVERKIENKINESIALIKSQEKIYCQIYLDDGKGTLEEKSIKKEYEGTKIYEKIKLENDIESIRLDPINKMGLVKINALFAIRKDGSRENITDVQYKQIEKIDEDIYMCTSDDPQIIILGNYNTWKEIVMDIETILLDKKQIIFLEQLVDKFKKNIDDLLVSLNKTNDSYNEAISITETLKQKNEQLLFNYNSIINSFTWKSTFPMRKLMDLIKSNIITRGIKCIKEHGIIYTIKLFVSKGYGERINVVSVENNSQKINHYILSQEEKKKQKEYVFSETLKISILVPLFNTKKEFLCDMIDSVIQQTYMNWELCLVDGSDEKHKEVGRICSEYVKKDTRILYKKLTENRGISENTNECLKMATGDYIGLFDHDDILHCSALFEVMKAIESKKADMIYTDEATFHYKWNDAYLSHYKPDYSPDTLRSYNYICHFTVFKRELFNKVGYFNKEFDGSQDYDYILRLTEKAKMIVHIPKILYYWRAHEKSVASDLAAKPYTIQAAKGALTEHLKRIGLKGVVVDSDVLSTYRIRYEIERKPKISILIPNKDHIEDLEKCVESIIRKTTYCNYEIIIIENNSEKESTFAYYEHLKKKKQIKIIYWKKEFNYSAINNFGEREATGDYILLLNNDIEIITENWIEEMLMFAQRPDVGAVGAMLYYPDDTVQHAGVILGIGGVAGHSHKYFKRGEYGYASRLTIAQNLSCVTAACLLVKKTIFEEVGGLDEKFAVAFNDVDFCMKIRKEGYLNIFTPYAELYHYESKSRGLEDTKEKQLRFRSEIDRFYEKWGMELKQGDPYYNINLSLDKEDFSCNLENNI